MGEEAKQDQAKAEAKPEEKVEEKPAEEKKEEPKPPSPVVLFVDLHCVGCAKKIKRSIMKIRGVEGVVIDMAQNQVTIKGIVEPQAVCDKIMKRAKRTAKVLSPLPEAEGQPIPEVVASQVSGPNTVELSVNMHCEACAEQLKAKILKMRGVQTATTELSTGKVTVTGTMDADKLVDYVYRRTNKQARIVPQPEPEKKEEEKPAEGEAKPAAEEIKGENAEKKEEEKPPEEAKKEEGEKDNANPENTENKDEGKKEGREDITEEESTKRMIYYYQAPYFIERIPKEGGEDITVEESMKRMIYYPPPYFIERIPPPQLFSDENPNACCIS